MAQEILCAVQLVAAGSARGELELERLFGERLDDGRPFFASRDL